MYCVCLKGQIQSLALNFFFSCLFCVYSFKFFVTSKSYFGQLNTFLWLKSKKNQEKRKAACSLLEIIPSLWGRCTMLNINLAKDKLKMRDSSFATIPVWNVIVCVGLLSLQLIDLFCRRVSVCFSVSLVTSHPNVWTAAPWAHSGRLHLHTTNEAKVNKQQHCGKTFWLLWVGEQIHQRSDGERREKKTLTILMCGVFSPISAIRHNSKKHIIFLS